MFEDLNKYEGNFINYTLFPYIEDLPNTPFEGRISTYENILDDLQLKLYEYVEEKILGFIWNQDKPPSITGTVFFGDSMQDEWLMVWILFQISKEFQKIVICVSDNDGDFILAESALEIPTWLTPENSKNRVFLYDGKIHIIPASISPDMPTINNALNIIRDNNIITLSLPVTEKIFEKINK
ncbi:Protein SGT1 [Smittium culicis]|uniref:Protein SGT1 n=1 Tax=Smittium culicis TaxID=133412 RepID=A0A1R1YCR8_9FUNG|nr:Protein SGT1 [Smittium culicis]OMJ24711.1 Protein SGT1 [Smittium culicis]